MGINIVAKRKLSLEGFAEGWGNASLHVKSVSEEKRLELSEILDGVDMSNIENVNKMRAAVADLIIDGVVISTDDEGKESPVKFVASDTDSLNAVVDALNGYWLKEVIFVATGLDRIQ